MRRAILRHRRFLLIAIVLVLVTGAASIMAYYEVYPGPHVLTVYLYDGGIGPSSRSEVVGQVISFNSGQADLLHISVDTNGSSELYLLDSAQVQEYLLTSANFTEQVLQVVLGHTTPPLFSTMGATGYPLSFLYASQFSQRHSHYLQVQKQTNYYLLELSLPNQTYLNFTPGAIQGYDSTKL